MCTLFGWSFSLYHTIGNCASSIRTGRCSEFCANWRVCVSLYAFQLLLNINRLVILLRLFGLLPICLWCVHFSLLRFSRRPCAHRCVCVCIAFLFPIWTSLCVVDVENRLQKPETVLYACVYISINTTILSHSYRSHCEHETDFLLENGLCVMIIEHSWGNILYSAMLYMLLEHFSMSISHRVCTELCVLYRVLLVLFLLLALLLLLLLLRLFHALHTITVTRLRLDIKCEYSHNYESHDVNWRCVLVLSFWPSMLSYRYETWLHILLLATRHTEQQQQ